jgi:hypothetical protein
MAKKLFKLAVNQDISSDFTSDWVNLNDSPGWSLGLRYAGAPTGTLFIDVGVDGLAKDNDGNPTDFTDITSIAVAAAGYDVIQDNLVGYTWVRFRYVATAGAGTLNAALTLKNVKGSGII